MNKILCLGLLALGCAPPPPAAPPSDDTDESAAQLSAGRPPAYLDVEETFTNEPDQTRWFDLKRALRRDFDDICGDTFCEGDYANLQALSFRCSVSVRTGQLKSCTWLFAGSYETVTPSTGTVRPNAKFFPCKIAVQGTPASLMDALLAPESRGPLWQPLPGTTGTIYDLLGTCL